MIIAVIPAQSKSTRLPGKNMKLMIGKPLIEYTIEYAQSCPLIDRIYVSTDSPEIAEFAKKKGVKALIRPIQLCGNVSIVEVLKHAVGTITEADEISHIIALQADHPDRKLNLTSLLQKAIQADIVDTITIDTNGVRNGSIRILKKDALMEDRISYSIIAVKDECTNIHYQEDFDKAASHLRETAVFNKKESEKKV